MLSKHLSYLPAQRYLAIAWPIFLGWKNPSFQIQQALHPSVEVPEVMGALVEVLARLSVLTREAVGVPKVGGGEW